MTAFWIVLGVVALWGAIEALLSRPWLATGAGWVIARLLGAKRTGAYQEGRGMMIYTVNDIPSIFEVFLGVNAGAITFGNIVLFDEDAHLWSIERHEWVHVTQYRRWGTIFFLLAYVASWLYFLVRTGNPVKAYYRIPFEQLAYKAQHGVLWEPPI